MPDSSVNGDTVSAKNTLASAKFAYELEQKTSGNSATFDQVWAAFQKTPWVNSIAPQRVWTLLASADADEKKHPTIAAQARAEAKRVFDGPQGSPAADVTFPRSMFGALIAPQKNSNAESDGFTVTYSPRVRGFLQLIGAIGEGTTAAGLAIAPDFTLTKVGAIIVGAHGLDQGTAAVVMMYYNKEQQTFTVGLLVDRGFKPDTAALIDSGLSVVSDVAGGYTLYKMSLSAAEASQLTSALTASQKVARSVDKFDGTSVLDNLVASDIPSPALSAPSGASKYNFDTFEGRRMYTAEGNFDLGVPGYVDPKYVHKSIRQKIESGWTNADLMRNGYAPIGTDGRQINLHHILGDEPGPMVELLGSTHQKFRDSLHGLIEDGNSFRNVPGLESQYNAFRGRYWEWRIEQIDAGQGF